MTQSMLITYTYVKLFISNTSHKLCINLLSIIQFVLSIYISCLLKPEACIPIWELHVQCGTVLFLRPQLKNICLIFPPVLTSMFTYMGVTCTMQYSFVFKATTKKYLFYITPYAYYRDDPG
jgi:hypothetical protein